MNKVILIGNLTKDPEQFVSSSNVMRCSFTVAVNRPYSSSDGSRQTDFLPVICAIFTTFSAPAAPGS